jgi:DUF1680 family protein
MLARNIALGEHAEPAFAQSLRRDVVVLGHLVEGAVAYARATEKRQLLQVVVRAVEHAMATFGTGPGQRRGYDAHAEMELAMVKLHGLTGDPRHLAFARFLVDERGRMPSYFDEEARARGQDPAAYHYKTYAYSQAHKPVREQAEVVGHAVRATYLYGAMADLAREDRDEQAFRKAELRRASRSVGRGQVVLLGHPRGAADGVAPGLCCIPRRAHARRARRRRRQLGLAADGGARGGHAAGGIGHAGRSAAHVPH